MHQLDAGESLGREPGAHACGGGGVDQGGAEPTRGELARMPRQLLVAADDGGRRDRAVGGLEVATAAEQELDVDLTLLTQVAAEVQQQQLCPGGERVVTGEQELLSRGDGPRPGDRTRRRVQE